MLEEIGLVHGLARALSARDSQLERRGKVSCTKWEVLLLDGRHQCLGACTSLSYLNFDVKPRARIFALVGASDACSHTSLRSPRTLRECERADRWRNACDGVQTRREAVALCPQKGRRHGRVAPHGLSLLSVIRVHDLLTILEQAISVIGLGVCVSHVPVVCVDGGCVGERR